MIGALHRRSSRPEPPAPPGPVAAVTGAAGLDRRALGLHVAVVAIALGLWGIGVVGADGREPTAYGLLDVLPAWWYAAPALLGAGFVAAATARHRPPAWLLWAHVGALIVVLHATVPVLFEEPRFAWSVKHVGPAELLGATGGVDRSIDIYNNWPGFFALASWISEATGVALMDLARWSQPAFAALFAAAAAFAARSVLRDERLVLAAVWVFVAANWVGQDIFAPQAPAFVLAMLLLGLVLRSAREPSGGAPSALRSGGTLVAVTIVWVALVVTHQLSPVLVLASLTVVTVVTRRLPLWVPLAFAAVEVAWLLQAWSWLDDNVDLFSPSVAPSARPEGFNGEQALAGYDLATLARLGAAATVVLAAVVGAVRRRKAIGRAEPAVYAVVLVPAAVVLVQRYGGEGPLRAYLFALPFVAALAVAACAPRGTLRPRRLGVLVALLLAAAPAALFGLELGSRVGPEDLRVAAWLERAIPAGSARVYPSDVAARETTAGYARLADGPLLLLSREEKYLGADWGADTARMLDEDLRSFGAPAAYVVFTPGQERYLSLYGLVPDGAPQRLAWALLATGRYAIAHKDGDAVVLRRVTPAA
ncbi:MAG TPA: hypothetical protein VD931_14125 [Baekduia sp.]|nr:hypothetical protein [Baekduia sp.]